MKIFALSDLHGDKHLAKEMAEKAAENKVDLVLLAGDLVDHEGSVEGIVGPFKAKGLEVGIIPGNHEGMAEIGFLVDKYGAKNLHGYIFKKGDVGIFGCGYGNIGLHQLDEQNVFNTLKKTH
ncbi:MAG: metallophosphoesterase, partial [Nanoarchaeota archaeon]|nr:metallophosphoesterase [Nanoarchaeota archaeon]